jgi:hypothetical protein
MATRSSVSGGDSKSNKSSPTSLKGILFYRSLAVLVTDTWVEADWRLPPEVGRRNVLKWWNARRVQS